MSYPIEISVRTVESCIVLDVDAQHFTYPDSGKFKNEVVHLLEKGHQWFVINCVAINIVDSYGLATILAAYKAIQEKGGNLALYGLNGMFEKLVKVTHLDKVLEIWPSEAQAVYYLSTLK